MRVRVTEMSEELASKESDVKDDAERMDAADETAANAATETPESDETSAGERAESLAAELEPTEVPPLDLDEYRDLLKRASERDVFLNELRRARADFENYQKRVKRELPARELQAVRRLLAELLPIQDNFELALADNGKGTVESVRQGVGMIRQLLESVLESHDTKPIDAEGQPFDPALHHAVQQLETDDPDLDGRVVAVLQTGYTHGDVVIRPARVVVGKRTSKAADEERAEG